MKKIVQTLTWLGLGVALALVAAGAYHYYELQKFRAEYERTRGVVRRVVTADSVHFYPIIQFKTLDNQRFTTKSRREEMSLAKGDTVEVYYDLANPSDMYLGIHRTPRQATWLAVSGLVLLLPSAVLGLVLLGRAQKARQLMAKGRKVKANVVEVQGGPLVAGKPLCRVVCEYANPASPDKPQRYLSNWLWAQPDELGNLLENKQLDVYQQGAAGPYHVDLSFLPEAMQVF